MNFTDPNVKLTISILNGIQQFEFTKVKYVHCLKMVISAPFFQHFETKNSPNSLINQWAFFYAYLQPNCSILGSKMDILWFILNYEVIGSKSFAKLLRPCFFNILRRKILQVRELINEQCFSAYKKPNCSFLGSKMFVTSKNEITNSQI